ncbi:hypothetical protein CAP35_07675 [Chitinophagaceae bacterium IBVUCB1]|nr:hypothetical protein CAP35_07675 [Chitinophagaceae bacterium IBVUCB1]
MDEVREDVVVARINVARKDSQQYFQVILPRDTQKIKGIECSAVLQSPLPVTNERFLGNLQLQAEGQTNLCYCTDIFLDRPNAQIPTLGFTGDSWMKKAFEQSGMRETEPLEIKDCHVLYGCFRDIIGQKLKNDLHYKVTFYIWIERAPTKEKT